MKKSEALDLFKGKGKKRKLAEALGISVQAVQAWDDEKDIPKLREYEIKEIMKCRKK